MDKLVKYRQLVKNILSEYTQYKPTGNDLEIQAIFETRRTLSGRYFWVGRRKICTLLSHSY